MSNIEVTIPTAKEADTMPLREAALALGLTRQAAFHMVRKGTFPVATSLNGTRVRVSTAALRKHLKLAATAKSVKVEEPVKRARRANGAAQPKPEAKPAAKTAKTSKTSKPKATAQTRSGRKALAAETPAPVASRRSTRTATARVSARKR